MLSNQEKLLQFNKSIRRELDSQIAQIDSEIEAYRQAQTQAIEEEVYADCYAFIQQSAARIRLSYTTELSHFIADQRRELLLKRDEYVGLILDEVRDRLLLFCGSPDYPEFLRRRFAAVAGEYRLQRPVVSVCERDLGHAPLLLSVLPEAEVRAVDFISIGGFVASEEGRGFILNETLDSALSQQREWFYSHSGLRVSQLQGAAQPPSPPPASEQGGEQG